MAALPRGVYANLNRTLYEPNKDPLIVSSIVGLSSINGQPYSGGGPMPTEAYANLLQLSSMNLYQNSTTLCFWDVSGSGVTSNISFSNYDITIGVDGIYKIGCSYQFNNQSGADVARYFFLKNDVAIPNTASFQTVSNNVEQVSYSEILESCTNGDRIQMGIYTASADVKLSTLGSPAAGVPNSPAAIATLYRIA